MNPTERALKALYSGDSQKTPEVVEALDEIVKNAGYSSHDSSGQLNLLFLKMLDRLFGEDVTTVGNPETVISAVYGSWSKSVLGGWLRAFISSQLDAASLIGSVPSIVRRSNAGVYEPPSLKLLKFLFPYSPFLGLLENTRVEYQWSLDLLPSKVKLLLSSKAATGVVDSVAAALFAKMIGNDVVTIGLEVSYFLIHFFSTLRNQSLFIIENRTSTSSIIASWQFSLFIVMLGAIPNSQQSLPEQEHSTSFFWNS